MAPTFVAAAEAFFAACDSGKGWEGCAEFCSPEASFASDALPFTTVEAYTEWMKGLVHDIAPDSEYSIISTTWNNTQVTIVGVFKGTHTLTGGPVPPYDPPKYMSTAYSYTLTFGSDGKIASMYKVWDKLTALKGWGWPI